MNANIKIPNKFLKVSSIFPKYDSTIGVVSNDEGLEKGRSMSSQINWIKATDTTEAEDFKHNRDITIVFFTNELDHLLNDLRVNKYLVSKAGESKPAPVNRESKSTPVNRESKTLFKQGSEDVFNISDTPKLQGNSKNNKQTVSDEIEIPESNQIIWVDSKEYAYAKDLLLLECGTPKILRYLHKLWTPFEFKMNWHFSSFRDKYSLNRTTH